MLSQRRRWALYGVLLVLLISGAIAWLGDPNWWDEPMLRTDVASFSRNIHSLLGFALLLLFGSVYWHSKQQWHRASFWQKVTGLTLWGLLLTLLVGTMGLLYWGEALYTFSLWSHAGSGMLMAMGLFAHVLLGKKSVRV